MFTVVVVTLVLEPLPGEFEFDGVADVPQAARTRATTARLEAAMGRGWRIVVPFLAPHRNTSADVGTFRPSGYPKRNGFGATLGWAETPP